MEIAERQKLEDEIRMKQEEVERIAEEVEQKDSETRKLQVNTVSHGHLCFIFFPQHLLKALL